MDRDTARARELRAHTLWLQAERTDITVGKHAAQDHALDVVVSLVVLCAGDSSPTARQLSWCWEHYLVGSTQVEA